MTTYVTINGPVPKAAGDVLVERKRQIEQEGFDSFHDDDHDAGDLACAGAAYALEAGCKLNPQMQQGLDGPPDFWMWHIKWWKPKDPRRDLVRAAALIIAEIERIDRQTDPASVAPG